MCKILIISPTPSHPQNAGSRVRIFRLCDALQQQGHDIHFAFIKRERGGDEEAMRRHWNAFYALDYTWPRTRLTTTIAARLWKWIWPQFVIPWKIDDWYDLKIDPSLIELHNRQHFDAVIVEYVFFSKALDCFDANVLKIIDTIDVFTDRHKFYKKHQEQPDFFYTTRPQERIGLSRADVLIAIQERERQFFSTLVQKPVITVGHPIKLTAPEPMRKLSNKRLLFVGSANKSNLKSIAFFLREIFPRLRQNYPETTLDIVGNLYTMYTHYQNYRTELPEGTSYHGEVADLAPYYQEADIVINPMLFATGLNIKMIEALGYGKPVVTTAMGCRGLEHGNKETFLLADTPEEFVQAIARIFDDPTLAHTLAQNAYHFAEHYHQQCLTPLLEIFERKECHDK